jgi:hypothetical protein
MRYLVFIICCMCLLQISYGQTIYVNSEIGSDQNSGTEKEPLKTIAAGIRAVNECNGKAPVTLTLFPGLYPLETNLSIEPNKNLTSSNRLTIAAAILPDDSTWRPESMPTIISIAMPEDIEGEKCTCTFNIRSDHVTIRGIKFLGNPSLTTKHFSIYRTNDTLTDLKVAQCIFLGDEDALPVQVAVLINGHSAEVAHCVFSNCRWAAIFFHAENWSVPIKNSSMHHCLITDCYGGALWTNLVDSDFQFYNNVIDKCNHFWVKNYYNQADYTVQDCVVTGVNVYKGEWRQSNNLDAGDYKLIEKNVIKEGSIDLIKRIEPYFTIDHNYLHLAKDSPGYDLHAGIFSSGNRAGN